MSTDVANDQACIAQLLRLGFTEGAVQHLDWRYEHYLTTGRPEQAEYLAQWFAEQTA